MKGEKQDNALIHLETNNETDTCSMEINGSILDISTLLFIACSTNEHFKKAVELVVEYNQKTKI